MNAALILVALGCVVLMWRLGEDEDSENVAELRSGIEVESGSGTENRQPGGTYDRREEASRARRSNNLAPRQSAAGTSKPERRADAPGSPPGPVLATAPEIREADKHALAAARRRVGITMYATARCPVCEKAREYLRQKGIPYNEIDIDGNPRSKKELSKLNPKKSVPTFDIDGIVMVGFSPGNLERHIDRAAREHL